MKLCYTQDIETPMLETKYCADGRAAGKLDGYRALKITVDTKRKIRAVSMLIRKTHRGTIFLGIRLLDQKGKYIVDKTWDNE